MADFRLTFVTADGSVLKNRQAIADLYFTGSRPETEFIESVLKGEARELGVRVISYTISKTGVVAVVDWLK